MKRLIAFVALILLLFPVAASPHCFSHWAYKTPQRGCGVSRETRARQPTRIVQPPPAAIPVLPGPSETDLRAAALAQIKLQLDALYPKFAEVRK